MAHAERLKAYGNVCLNAGCVLQLSWIPILGFMGGWDWPPLKAVIGGHYFALSFLFAAPAGLLLKLLSETPAGERLALAQDWAWRCFTPLAAYALGTKLFLRMIPHITVESILFMMGVNVLLAVYAIMLLLAAKRELSAAA